LTRPDNHNAFDDSVIAGLTEAFKKAAGDADVRAVILASEGKSFCAGADINWMRRMAGYTFDENLADANKLAEMLHRLNTLPVPTIARVQGAAYGGGVGLACCCDMVVASPRAAFCLSEVKIGLIPATIGPYVVAAIGERASRRYFATAEVITAEKAQELGLVSELVGEDKLDQAIEDILSGLLRNGPEAVRDAKRLALDISKKEISKELMAETSRRIADRRSSDEGKEGLSAFLEKRKPAWIKK
jgi:methylglutaconyl-CoA hydratase